MGLLGWLCFIYFFFYFKYDQMLGQVADVADSEQEAELDELQRCLPPSATLRNTPGNTLEQQRVVCCRRSRPKEFIFFLA